MSLVVSSDLTAGIRYDDAPRAMDWLERAFGFERDLVVPGEHGGIAFAYMRLGDDFIFTGTTRPDVKYVVGVYVEDVDAVYRRAVEAGVEMMEELHDAGFGRLFVAWDVGGHIWSSGTVRPEKPPGCDIFPVLGYEDEEAAITFLQQAFGLEERQIYRDDAGKIVHSELGIGFGIVMPKDLDATSDNPWDQAPFGLAVHVDDPDAHYARARAAGAEIVRELRDEGHGRGYSARDVEGNLWDFSTYRPPGSRP